MINWWRRKGDVKKMDMYREKIKKLRAEFDSLIKGKVLSELSSPDVVKQAIVLENKLAKLN